jgi:Protein of unknown function, DUF481
MMLVGILGLVTVARAEDPAFTTPQAEKVEKAETHLTGELGGTVATGNSSFYAINGLVNFSHKVDMNKISAVAGTNIGGAVVDVDGNGVVDAAERGNGFEPNAKRIYADARYDRFLSDKDSLYFLAGVFSDQFAGYNLRSHEQVGYSRVLIKEEKADLKAELGVDWAQEFYVEEAGLDNSAKFLAARVLVAAGYKFNDSVGVTDTFEVYENVLDFADLRILNTAALTSSLSKNLSLKLSHSLIFDNVPVEGFQPLDQTAMATIVVTLL